MVIVETRVMVWRMTSITRMFFSDLCSRTGDDEMKMRDGGVWREE